MAAIDLTLGCIFIGVILNVWLYGFSCVQAYIYYSRFKEDKPSMRGFVAILFTADTVNTVLDIVFLYRYLVTNFGDGHYASRANNEFATDPILVSMIGFMTQLFFAWRVWKLTNHRLVWVAPCAIVLVGFLSFISAIGTTIGVVLVRDFALFQKFQVAVILWLAGAAVADAIITASLIITLHKARTGFSQTDDIITKLIRGTLQTGLLTASFAIIDLILFLASSSTLHLVFNLPLAKLYVNSLLSTLNARAFAQNSRYTMNSSALRNIGNNQLKQQESGAIRSGASTGKGFNPVSSNSEATAVAESKTSGGRKPYFAGRPGTRSQDARDDGIHILTVEERFESTLPDNGPRPLPYSSGRGPRTPGEESRKTSEDSLSDDNFGVTQESLAMTSVTNREQATAARPSSPPAVRPVGNHPYNRY